MTWMSAEVFGTHKQVSSWSPECGHFYQRPAWGLGGVLIAGFELGEEERALGGGAGAAHELASSEGLKLSGGGSGVPIGKQIGGGQRCWVPQVNVQGVDQRAAFLHDADSGVVMPVNASFVPLGVAEPAFQIEIIAWQLHRIAPGKEPGLKTAHPLSHLLMPFAGAGLQLIA